MIVGGVAVLSLALAYLGVDKFWPSKPVATEQPVAEAAPTVAPAATAIPEKSIAVLPFTDMSEKHDQEYLADGMAEEILESACPGSRSARLGADLIVLFQGEANEDPATSRESSASRTSSKAASGAQAITCA